MKVCLINFETLNTSPVSELEALLNDLGYEVVKLFDFKPRDRKFVGKGQLESVRNFIQEFDDVDENSLEEIKNMSEDDSQETDKINAVVYNGVLSGLKYKQLEKFFGKKKILSRIDVIIRVFEKRALTNEGRLQIKLASLLHQKTKLVRAWTHLERQKGGTSTIGGPGEKQIELDKRMISQAIEHIKKQLKKVKQDRGVRRGDRQEKVVAIVGYSNAGKTRLFNALTNSDMSVSSKPFETLDPHMRKCFLPNQEHVILSDTVGFVTHLPPFLVKAFQATLEEIVEADMILWVTDSANIDDKTEIEKWFKRLGVENKPILRVYSKADLLDEIPEDTDDYMYLSSNTSYGVNKLLEKIQECVGENVNIDLSLSYDKKEELNWLFNNNIKIGLDYQEDSVNVKATLKQKEYNKFIKLYGQI